MSSSQTRDYEHPIRNKQCVKIIDGRLLNELVGGPEITMINGLRAADADIGESTDIVARR